MNWIVMPVRNGLAYTREAIKTFKTQTIGSVKVLVVDNSSNDGTAEYLRSEYPFVITVRRAPPISVSAAWNLALNLLFQDKVEYALVVNNDVELLPETYEALLESGYQFATGIGVNKREQFHMPSEMEVRDHPDFSCFLMKAEIYEKVGEFDENFLGAYGEDADYHLRMHQAGVRAVTIGVPFLHHASGTIKSADAEEAMAISRRADRNREYFKRKWGVEIGSPEYYDMFKEAGRTQDTQF